MLARRSTMVIGLLIILAQATALSAQDAFYDVPFGDLKITAGEFPKAAENEAFAWRNSEIWDAFFPRVELDGAGEGYVAFVQREQWQFPSPWDDLLTTRRLVIRAPQGKDVTGRLVVPKRDSLGMTAIKFTVPASAAKESNRDPFSEGKAQHYRWLQNRNLPGTAWFRHQADLAQQQITNKKQPTSGAEVTPFWQRRDDLDAYALFSGGRALSENLQLERRQRGAGEGAGAATVDISSLTGITVAEIDWKPLLKDAQPKLDALAQRIPADQHAVFFPSFNAAMKMADELGGSGNPELFRLAEPRSEDADVQKIYERQLGLSMTALGRLLGPTMISSMALTGSDPYFRTGTDVAVLFETQNGAVFASLVHAQVQLAAAKVPDAKPQTGTVAGVSYNGFRSPDRRLSSYVAQLPGAVVVTNSLAQLERLAKVSQGASLASLDEYRFFRVRYPLGEANETAFVFLSDATIRRWCSPQWRIATARRTFAAAALAELTAENLNTLAATPTAPQPLRTDIALVNGGELTLTPAGVSSSTLGRLEWMTPIVETPIEKVTQEEAQAYEQWRTGYQRNWRWAFDPIGVRISLRDDQWAADLTVMPLIAGTEYRDIISVARGAEIKPNAGDRHGALAHFALAINAQSLPVQQGSNFVSMMAPGIGVNPLSWLGGSIAVYVDDDPLWKEWKDTPPNKRREFEERMLGRLPIALHAEVSNPLKLTAFLAAVRAFIEQTSPGMTAWESLTHREQPYVRVRPTDRARGMMPTEAEVALYYAPTGDGLLVTLSETVLKRALDRRADREAAAKTAAPKSGTPTGEQTAKTPSPLPWLGQSFCLQIDRQMFDLLTSTQVFDFDAEQLMQARSWSNLPILNEWKRVFPDQDPVELHARLWSSRLTCPGGGSYVWNDEWKTMESTLYGHPGQPKIGPRMPTALDRFSAANFGLTFEEQGLRARMELQRTAPKK